VSASGGTPPLDRFWAGGAPGASEAQDVPECHDPQDPSIEAVRVDGTPVLETVLETDTTTVVGAVSSTMMSEVAASGTIAPSSPAVGASQMLAVTTSAAVDDDAPEEPEVVMGHPSLGALG
jgi:hypothetical protein